MFTIISDYGDVQIGMSSISVTGNGSQLRAWAFRPNCAWPCSELAKASEIWVVFDHNNLVKLEGDDCIDLSNDELNAWMSDVLGEILLPADHPCYLVTVGQFFTSLDTDNHPC